MRYLINVLGLMTPLLVAVGPNRAVSADERDEPKRMVLVELYTSQGCDMCPTAEKMLGALAERDRGIVPIAFHVDYFNDPWKDVFSDPLYSQRQMTYNQLYTKPKNPEYGLYYTPMLMIDGEQSVNGRDAASAEAAIRRARAKKPAVALDVTLDLKSDGLSGTATIKVTSRSARAEKSPLLVCAVLREDGVVTDIPVGRERRQVARRALPRASDEIRVHRTRRQVARDAAVSVRDRADLEPAKPSAGRVRSGQAHGRGPPGGRPSLAIDPDRRDAAGSTAKVAPERVEITVPDSQGPSMSSKFRSPSTTTARTGRPGTTASGRRLRRRPARSRPLRLGGRVEL